jgi:hypothetical protein
MPDSPSKDKPRGASPEAEAAAAQLASVVAFTAAPMGAVLGCCQGLLILLGGFVVGLLLFGGLHLKKDHHEKDNHQTQGHPRGAAT